MIRGKGESLLVVDQGKFSKVLEWGHGGWVDVNLRTLLALPQK